MEIIKKQNINNKRMYNLKNKKKIMRYILLDLEIKKKEIEKDFSKMIIIQ